MSLAGLLVSFVEIVAVVKADGIGVAISNLVAAGMALAEWVAPEDWYKVGRQGRSVGREVQVVLLLSAAFR